MKKIAFFTSVLALGACAISNGDSDNDSEILPPFVGAPQVLPADESNAFVTSLGPGVDLTQIEFDDPTAGFKVDDQGRISSVNIDGEEYFRNADTNTFANYSYKIEIKNPNRPAEFEFFSTDANLAPEYVKEQFLSQLNSWLDSMIYAYGPQEWIGMTDEEFTEYYNSLPEYKQFYTKSIRNDYVQFKNKIDAISNPNDYDRDYEEIAMNSYGKMANLKFADFGMLTETHGTGRYKYETVYAMGRSDKKMDLPETIASEMVFNGSAVGWVKMEHETSSNKEMVLNGDTRLVVGTDKVANLSANFDNWYTVNVSKVGDINATISFDGTNKTIAQGFGLPTEQVGRTDSNIKYLGENGQISEAVGTVKYSNPYPHGVFKFDFAFGVNKE